MKELLFKELSFKIIGIAFEIDNSIGYGQKEKIYADAFEKLLIKSNIKYAREVYSPLKVAGEVISKKFYDFLVDDKIAIEIKKGSNLYRQACSQLFQYLKANNYKLGLIIRFTKNGVKIKRIPCFY